MPVSNALARILAGAIPLEHETVGLLFALDRTLASPLAAQLTQPPFNSSAMDGYAVRAADAPQAGVTLDVIGKSAAGHPFDGHLEAGQAIRIFTGAEIPSGADAVVLQEDTTANGNKVTLNEGTTPGANIRPRGQDFRSGDWLLPRGQKLAARDILLAAAAGHAALTVVRKPVVAIVSTGDELVEPGDEIGPGQIVASNGYGIAALVEAAGAAPHLIGIADDTVDDITDAIRAAATADILVTVGGASVGDADLVRPALEKSGATLEFQKIAMRPGKPTFFGTRPALGRLQRCMGLPGNPVSAMISARLFLVPLIAALLGRKAAPDTFGAVLATPIAANGPRDHYMRAQLDRSVYPPLATPISSQDSAMISSLARAEGLLVIPANAPALEVGSPVTAMTFDF